MYSVFLVIKEKQIQHDILNEDEFLNFIKNRQDMKIKIAKVEKNGKQIPIPTIKIKRYNNGRMEEHQRK